MITAPVNFNQNRMTHDERVGERVMMLMFRARLSQKALGEKVGMTQTAISHKIRGTRKWTLDDLFAVAAAFGVPVSYLIENDEKAPTPKGEGSNVGPAGIEPTTSTV